MSGNADYLGTNSKKQQAYYHEYFQNDGNEGDELQGNWLWQKS